MASSQSRSNTRIISTADRLIQRVPYGNLTSVHEAALLELAAGNLKNAWALLQEALGEWLQATWREVSGRPNAGVTDRKALILKLYNRKSLDRWSFDLLNHAITHPHGYDLRRVDMLAGIVRVFVFDKPPAAVLIPDDTKLAPESVEERDPRQVEQWIPVPAVAPVPAETVAEPTNSSSSPPKSSQLTESVASAEEANALNPQKREAAPRRRADAHAHYRKVGERNNYEPTEAEIEKACRKIIADRYPTFPLRDDEYRSPHWREHQRALEAIGLS